jgi:AcrR family transcriptional regulator
VVSGRSRRTAALRREEILTATLEVVEREGLAATRVSDVASALGVSPALVFYHFRTKADLVAAAFAHAAGRDVARLEEIAGSREAPVDRLRRMLRLYGPTGPATGWRLWIDAWALAQREDEIQAVMRDMDQRWCAVLREVVDAGVRSDEFHCPDPAAAVTRISALLDGLSVATLVYGSVTRTQLRDWVADAVARELRLDPAVLA